MDHGDFEFWGFKKVEGHYDVINGGQRKKSFFFDLRLRLELMLDGWSTDLKKEKRFQETDRLGVVCHHLGYDTAPGGFVRGAQKWGKIFARAFLRANSILRRANFFGMSKIDVKPYSLPTTTLISHLFPKFRE